MTPEGYYPAKITEAWVEVQDAGPLLCFDTTLTMPDGTTVEETAKHPAWDKGLPAAKAVAELLNIAWPDGLETIETCIGAECDVKIKHKVGERHTFLNAYIVTQRQAERATKDQIKAAVAKMAAAVGADDDCPF